VTDVIRVRADDQGPVTVVSVTGKILFDTYVPLLDVLLRLAERPQPRIIVNLAAVPVCDSTGLSVLIQIQRRATANGGWLRLAEPQPLVARVLDLTNLRRVLPVYDTVTHAVAGQPPAD
jgi:anti-sigma B factor antagonist